MSPKSRMFWNVLAIPRRVILTVRCPAIGAPLNRIEPEVGV